MEIRVWNEAGDIVGYCVVKEDEKEAGCVNLELYPGGTYEETISGTSWDLAVFTAQQKCEKWKKEAEAEFERIHGEKPKGVMSETGFYVQEVEG